METEAVTGPVFFGLTLYCIQFHSQHVVSVQYICVCIYVYFYYILKQLKQRRGVDAYSSP
jgi:hypothetical protein